MSDTQTPSSGERIQKIIAQAGIASRRDAEELIREGKVMVNGKTASLGDKATLGKDSIKVRGRLIQSTEQKVYYIIYKPKNVIGVNAEDEEGRPTLYAFTKRIKERVFMVGRMDFMGEGIILLTNDGAIAQRMQKSNDIIRRYHVKVDRHPTPIDIEKLARGGRIEGRSMVPFHVRLANAYAKNALIEISFEGMGAIEIRKFFENKGFYPERIACVGIGHIAADKMAPGMVKKLEGSTVEALFTQPELAKTQIEKLKQKKAYVKEAPVDESTAGGKTVAIKPSKTRWEIKAPKSFGPDAVNEATAESIGSLTETTSPFARNTRTPRKTDAYATRDRAVKGRVTDGYAPRASAAPARGKSKYEGRTSERSFSKSAEGFGKATKPGSRTTEGYAPRKAGGYAPRSVSTTTRGNKFSR
jgi:23S rRNA pseudouridine2605 synthase